MKKILWLAVFYLIFGLSFGVFYREFTRAMNFEGNTALSFVHPHILTLGFLFFLLIILLDKVFAISKFRYYSTFLYVYNFGLLLSIIAMIARGILDVTGFDFEALSYIAGLGHITVAIGLGFFIKTFFLSLQNQNKPNSMQT